MFVLRKLLWKIIFSPFDLANFSQGESETIIVEAWQFSEYRMHESGIEFSNLIFNGFYNIAGGFPSFSTSDVKSKRKFSTFYLWKASPQSTPIRSLIFFSFLSKNIAWIESFQFQAFFPFLDFSSNNQSSYHLSTDFPTIKSTRTVCKKKEEKVGWNQSQSEISLLFHCII